MQTRYWLRGLIIYTVIGIIAIPIAISFFYFEPWHSFEQNGVIQSVSAFFGFEWLGKIAIAIIAIFGPGWMIIAMGLGMNGQHFEISENLVAIVVPGILAQLLWSFSIGSIIGALYGKFSAKNLKIWFIFFSICIVVLMATFLNYRWQSSWAAYDSVSFPAECNGIAKKFISNFDANRCLKNLAVKNKDVGICDAIIKSSSIEKDHEDFKWFCYQDVALVKKDPSICESIPAQVYQISSKSTTSSRRDGCFGGLLLCDKIISNDWKENCIRQKSAGYN